MTHLEIKIQAAGEPPASPEYGDADMLQLKGITIMEGVTNGGRTGVVLLLQDEAGKKYCANTTGRIVVNAMASATRGAMLRFNDNPDAP